MKKVILKDKVFKPLISTPFIEEATRDLAAVLNEKFKYEQEPVIFITVLNGAVPFASSLFMKLKFPVVFDTVKVSSYIGTRKGELKLSKKPDNDTIGKKVIIVDDIIDTGDTTDYLEDYFWRHGAIDILITALLLKPEVYKKKHEDFTTWGLLSGEYKDKLLTGFNINDVFVVGYGLDYDGLGRNLNKIYYLDESETEKLNIIE